MKVACDYCHKEFEWYTSETRKGKFIVGSALCPHCGYRYLSYVMDDRCKDLKRKSEIILKKIRKLCENQPYNKIKVDKLNRQYIGIVGGYDDHKNHITGEIDKRMSKLKDEYLEGDSNG